MNERAVVLGEDRSLVGVLSEPSAGGTPLPAVLLWNAGLLHRVGPARLYVDLARRLAAAGHAVLRFDLSGRGDSRPPQDPRPDRERAIAEIRSAMDFVQQACGASRFILIGLCTGADHAHAVAAADARVCGLVAIDGYAYPTRRFRLRRALDVLGDPPRAAAALRRRLWPRRDLPGSRPTAEGVPDLFAWAFPAQAAAEDELAAMATRGMQALFLYSGESFATYNYRDQFRDMFAFSRFQGRIAYAYLTQADHLFSLPGNRALFVDTISHWVTRQA